MASCYNIQLKKLLLEVNLCYYLNGFPFFSEGRQIMQLPGGFLLFRNFSVAISVSPHVCFILVLIFISMFLRFCTYELGIIHANRKFKCLRNQGRTKGEGWSTAN